jgi:hypothetical protein
MLGEPGLVGDTDREAFGNAMTDGGFGAIAAAPADFGSGPTGGGGRASTFSAPASPFGRFSFQREELGDRSGGDPVSAQTDVTEAAVDKDFPHRAQLSPPPAWNAPHDIHVGIPLNPERLVDEKKARPVP